MRNADHHLILQSSGNECRTETCAIVQNGGYHSRSNDDATGTSPACWDFVRKVLAVGAVSNAQVRKSYSHCSGDVPHPDFRNLRPFKVVGGKRSPIIRSWTGPHEW